jgi:hypothetical protein
VFIIIYKVIIRDSELCDCENEGDLTVQINKYTLKTYFQADADFYEKHILKGRDKEMNIDLWLVYGLPKKIDKEEKTYPSDTRKGGGTFRGRVISIMNEDEFRLDCGLYIDVDSEIQLDRKIKVGDYIEITGTYQVFFPETKYERD